MVVAPGRADRPGAEADRIEAPTPDELERCPFCEGRERSTPPEVLALPHREPPDAPGWRVRVVPNLYPGFARHEVVVHSARHARSFAELGDDEAALVAEAWQARRKADPSGYLHALVNEGRAAGATQAHSHSQLVWLDDDPPTVGRERSSPCGVCEVLAQHGAGRAVAERDGAALVVPRAGRVPFELLIAPRSHAGDAFGDRRLAAALSLLADGVRRLRAVEGHVAWNAWLHDSGHWHLEVLPRLTVFGGIELGAGVYVNPLPPEEAAALLREAPAG